MTRMRIDHLRMKSEEIGGLVPPRLRSRLVFRAKGWFVLRSAPRKRPYLVLRKDGDVIRVWVFRGEVMVLWEGSDGLPVMFCFKGVDVKDVVDWLEEGAT